MNNGLGVGALVHSEVQRCFTGGPLLFSSRLPFMIDPHEILRCQKTQGRVLSGDEKLFLADPVAEVTSPAADEPPLEKKLSPADHLTLQRCHAFPSLSSFSSAQGKISFSMG